MRQQETSNRRTRQTRSASSMSRGAGYCENGDCRDYAKSFFLLNHSSPYVCSACGKTGIAERERGEYTGNPVQFKLVKVCFDFDSVSKCHRQAAIVRDENLTDTRSEYTLYSPLIKTEGRALRMAEDILSNLNRYSGVATLNEDGVLPRTSEILLSFDSPLEEFRSQLHDVFDKIAEAERAISQEVLGS